MAKKRRKNVYVHEFYIKVTHPDKLTSRVRAEALREIVMQYLRRLPTFTGVQQIHPVYLSEAFTWKPQLDDEQLQTAINVARAAAAEWAQGNCDAFNDLESQIGFDLFQTKEFKPPRKFVRVKKKPGKIESGFNDLEGWSRIIQKSGNQARPPRKVVKIKRRQ